MSLISLKFFCFVVLLIAIYFIVPKKWQWSIILIANMVFYGSSGIKYLFYIIWVAFVTWLAGIFLEKIILANKDRIKNSEDENEKKQIREKALAVKKRVCFAAILLSMGVWVVLKYTDFFVETINSVIAVTGHSYAFETMNFILPLGMSFYTFDAVGYMVDVYREKYPAQYNYFKYLSLYNISI